MTGRHSAVVAEPVALAQLEQMLDDAPRTDPKRARTLASAHRRRSITWTVWSHPQMRNRVVVPVPAFAGPSCSSQHPATGYVCSRPQSHGGRHSALRGFVRAGETSPVYGVWSGGAR